MTPRDPVYRVCMDCGVTVNVSRFTRQDKKYLCPRCAGCPWYMTRAPRRKEARPRSPAAEAPAKPSPSEGN